MLIRHYPTSGPPVGAHDQSKMMKDGHLHLGCIHVRVRMFLSDHQVLKTQDRRFIYAHPLSQLF